MSFNEPRRGPWGRLPERPSPFSSNGRGTSEGGGDFFSNLGIGPEDHGKAIRFIAFVFAFIFVCWAGSGFYTVQPNEVGLNVIFGRFVSKTDPGLHFNWPYPVGEVVKPSVTDRNALDVGFATRAENGRQNALSFNSFQSMSDLRDIPKESLMLTGDQNIADVKFRVIWQIDPLKPEAFVFNVRAPSETIKAVSESAMRELVGRTPIQRLLTADRSQIEPAAQTLIQDTLDKYNTGVKIIQVQLLPVDPPEQVIAAFKDVTVAQQDKDRLQNEAETYANQVVPQARGNAARIMREAEAYKAQTVAQAKGQASRFSQIYTEYKLAPQVTRERLYLEMMEQVLGATNKTILDSSLSNTVLPYALMGKQGEQGMLHTSEGIKK